jgi:hypothetical protein
MSADDEADAAPEYEAPAPPVYLGNAEKAANRGGFGADLGGYSFS